MTTAPPLPSGGWAASTAPVVTTASRSRIRRAWALSGSLVLVAVSFFLEIIAVGIHLVPDSASPSIAQVLALVGLLPMLAVSVFLIWRHRFPAQFFIVATTLTVLLPTTPLPALLSLAALTAVRRGRLRWALVGATFVATVVSLTWDVAAHSSFLAIFVGSPEQGSPGRTALFWIVPPLAALMVAPFAAFGFSRQLTAERDLARLGNATAARNIAALHQEVSMERERQEIARELHDTLAARLSSVSLHAGALELRVGDSDARVTAAARAVRESAQHSLDDLRSVVRVIRNPELNAVMKTGLVDVGALIDASVGEGADIRSQIFVGDPSSCDPDVAHACYRIIQEAISNARRHAPGVSLFVDLRGGPETGLTIRTVNWLVPGAHPTSTGGGNGVTGMGERVALVGGSFEAGATQEGTFAVVAWLPWRRR